ncbi:hypothetical protein TIFTF001_023291 [Ficus carica]|uniref:Potassium channel tetramerisation-type BTB domain-containing protein n=1 Tax=Ficus carica TaxID=3494 RepID=A0AA88AK73_FICCA|nr:hypothetical protein TIFTF001_023291 [Ficus carica]
MTNSDSSSVIRLNIGQRALSLSLSLSLCNLFGDFGRERNRRIFKDTEETSDVICDRVKSWVAIRVHHDKESCLFLCDIVRGWGGKKYWTTVDTLTQREPHSMLAAMFSGRHTVCQDPEKGFVFVDRDGKHFRHILNWLRDGVVPTLKDSEYSELLREAEYYQLLCTLVDGVVTTLKDSKWSELPPGG